ncbi:MAG: beta-propeller fold lactonase family protein [Phycisphaerae bacterium]|nr:beta-propeller fold lactonase family protein [Phycisphaerae bacterium]
MINNTLKIYFLTIMALATTAYAADNFLSPTQIISGSAGQKLYISEQSANQVAVFDIATKQVVNIATPGSPSGLALSPDGSTLYVAIASADGKLCKINIATNTITATYPVGHTPTAIVASPDGQKVYIANRFGNTISIYDTSANAIETVSVIREPFDLAITPDSSKLVVANFLPDGSAVNASYISAKVSLINTVSKAVTNIALPNGSTLVCGTCISPDGNFAYITHLLGRYQLPTNQIERGWIITNAMSIIDLQTDNLIGTILLDDVDLGAANPWDITTDADGLNLYITHAGTHEISIINRQGIHQKLSTSTNPERDLGFMAKVARQRIATKVKGPRGVAIADGKVWVTGYFSTDISSIDLAVKGKDQVKTYSLGTEPAMTDARRGYLLYNDADICFQKWLSCASCHPDGRNDALNWDELNDGFGNAKQTKSHLYSHQTPPTTITGCRPNAETSVRAGLLYAYFQIRPADEAVAIDEYLKALRPVPSPRLVNGQLSASALRGKAIYDGSANCAVCHNGPYLTDMKLHNVGTGSGRHAGTKFDTPTLKEIWRTAPYLYDGRAATISDVLTTYNQGDAHGATSQLTEDQLTDLVEYIMSL